MVTIEKENKLSKVLNRLRNLQTALFALLMLFKTNPLLLASAFAGRGGDGADGRAKSVINGALSVLFLIISVVGVLFVMYGLAKWVMAHSQGDGPAINSAMMFIASGLGLLLLKFILQSMGFADWIDATLLSNTN